MARVHNAALLAACLFLITLVTPLGRPHTRAVAAQIGSEAVASSARTATVNPELLGMVVRDPWYDFGTYPGLPNEPNRVAQERMGALLAETGVRWVRMEFFVEGSDADAFERNISRYDYFINEVAPRHNLRVLGLLGFGVVRDIDPLDPTYGIISTTMLLDQPYGGGVNAYMRSWLDRSLAIANRYQGRVASYEVLNEQNRLPTPNAGRAVPAELAARLHAKLYRLLKYPQPDDGAAWRASVKLLVGGLHPRGTLEPGQKGYLSDIEYIRLLYGYKQDGSAPISGQPFQEFRAGYGRYPLDGFAYHPYPEEIRLSLQSDVDLIMERLDSVHATLDALGDQGRQLWITEIGYNAGFKLQTSTEQGDFLRTIYTRLGGRGDVATIFWFKYEDFPPGSGSNAQKWGLLHIPFSESAACPGGACYEIFGEPAFRRPAYFVYRDLAGLQNERITLPMLSQ